MGFNDAPGSGVPSSGPEALKLRALEFLKNNKEPIVYSLTRGAWNFAAEVNEKAKELSNLLDDGRHTGSSFGYALKDLIHTATTDLGYASSEEEKDGNRIVTLTPGK